MTRYRFLFADPESNNYLRLSDALAQLHDETLTLSQTVARGDLDHFFARMGRDATEEFRSELSNALEMKEPIEQAVAHTRGLKIDFKRETEGLAPLAHAEASLDEAKQAEQRVREALSPILSNSDYVNAVQEHQDRRVDAALEELEPDTAIYRPVDPHLKLSKGWRYRLRVHIGQRSDDSLMVGEPPPLDPLLPEPEGEAGHKLEVVVFEKDFTLLSPRVQSLRLPPLRGSKPVYFELIAPELDEAELRIGIYHRNHLLQSFVLEAEIGTGDWVWHQEKQVRVRLNFSRTARFTNLNSLAPRAMSIGVNQDLAGAAHTFMLKRDDEALPVHLTEDILFKQVKEFREILQEATADSGGNPRFATYPQPGAPPSPDFEEVVRRLAEFGRELYRAIFIRSTRSMQKELRDIAGREDDTIQIVRHDPNFAFPWPVLYDFELPQKTAGAQPSPICLGGAGSAAGRTKLCSHGPKDKVYCIYGFWGLRHRVEQLVALGDNLQDAVDKVQPGTESGVCLAVGEIDEHTSRMASELRSKLGSAVVELMPEDDILDVLWQSQKRPAILVVLGHLETAKIDGEPEGPRIVLHPKKKWLQAAPITDRQILDGDWEQPRTLIMLMACGSAATDISTLNDLATAFNSVGAAAVVGTECAAFSRLVARFAEEVTADLWGGVSLGEAVMAFNRRLVNSGNPLAFVFSYLGDADLKIVAP